MRAAEITLAGQVYYLAFNGMAMFAFEDAFGSASEYLKQTSERGSIAFESTCKAVSILAEQGELARRALGYDKGPLLTEERVRAVAGPLDIPAMQAAVARAITAGYKRDVEGDDDVDVGLIELEQKKGNG